MTREVGYQVDPTLASWGTLAQDTAETNPDLAWPASIAVFDKMRREDSQVSSGGGVSFQNRSVYGGGGGGVGK